MYAYNNGNEAGDGRLEMADHLSFVYVSDILWMWYAGIPICPSHKFIIILSL
jgi:hypothetical protein